MKVQKGLCKYIYFLTIIFILSLSNIAIKAQCLNGWQYYMPVVIVNTTSTSISNFQVKISVNTSSLIAAGKMIAAGDDIRFVDSGGCNIINYWIESGINTTATSIWLKMPILPANAHRTIKMYYGNSSAMAGSNGDSTFAIYDDFNGSSLNTAKWTNSNTVASYSVSGGKLSINSGSGSTVGTYMFLSNASFPSPIIVEGMITSLSGYYPCLGMVNSGTCYGYALYDNSLTTAGTYGMSLGASAPYTFHSPPYYSANIVSTNTSPGTLTGLWQVSWPAYNIQNASWPNGSFNTTFTGTSLASTVQVAFGMTFTSIGNVSFDWVRARVYASSDPTFSFGNEVINSFIQTSNIPGSPFCSNSNLSISYSIVGSLSFNSGNVFTAQLSDSSGSFASPANLGTLSSTSGGSINITIPSTAVGNHYRFRVISSNPAIIGSSTAYVSVPARSIPGFTFNQANQCLGNNSYIITNTTSGPVKSYKWSLGDGNFVSDINPSFSYASQGTYIIKLYSTSNAGCVDSITKSVIVYPQDKAGFSINSANQCLSPQNFTFADQSTVPVGSITSWLWNFGDNTSSSSQNTTHKYTSVGTYTVKLTATTDKGCTDLLMNSVTVYPMPVAGFTINNSNQCYSTNSFNITNTSTGSGSLNFKWVLGDGNFSTSQSLIHSYSTEGTFPVTLYATTTFGCIDSSSQNIVVYPKVKASFTVNANQCFNQQNFSFLNTSQISTGALAHLWTFGDGSPSSTVINPLHIYKDPGTYLVKLVSKSDKGCTDSFSQVINVNINPVSVIQASGNTKICQGESVVLFSDPSSDLSYQWLKDSKLISGATNASITVITSGNYQATLVNKFGCTDTSKSINIFVNPIPIAPEITKTGRVLSASKSFSYQWIVNDSAINGAVNSAYDPDRKYGIYSVIIKDSNGCSNTSLPYFYDVSGIESKLLDYHVNIYPNPAHNYINVELTGIKADFENILILDMEGRVVERHSVLVGNGIIEIPLLNESKGIYLLKLIGRNDILTQKFSIE